MFPHNVLFDRRRELEMTAFRTGRYPSVSGIGRCCVSVIAAGALLLAAAPGALASRFERRPVLFVHGVESAGSIFASQQMRFESNGYSHGWVEALDYNSLAAAAEYYNGEVEERSEKAIGALKQRRGKSQVVGVGSSDGRK